MELREVAHCIYLIFYGVASSSSAGVPRSLRQRGVKGSCSLYFIIFYGVRSLRQSDK